jgi:hypothetical protein
VTVTFWELLLYAGGMAALWVVPGPVWVALTARALTGGFASAWPLAVGVAIGDAVWPLAAIFGLTWILSIYGGFLDALQWVAAIIFVVMGLLLFRKSGEVSSDSRLTRPGKLAGFVTGLAVVIGNPKAILFYMGMLPGFFDLSGYRRHPRAIRRHSDGRKPCPCPVDRPRPCFACFGGKRVQDQCHLWYSADWCRHCHRPDLTPNIVPSA